MASISIVTISYNQAGFLQECIDSVASQRNESLQYIVVDPGSADASRDVIQNNADKIDHAVLDKDDGPADGLNKGFAKATGDVFGYINADDRFVPGALEFVSDYFDKHPDVDVLCGAIRIIDESGRASYRKRTSDQFDLANYISGICTIGQQATFFRKKAFELAGGFNANNRITWDGELLVDMAMAKCHFESILKVLGDFRVYPESITGSNKFMKQQRDEFTRIKNELLEQQVALHSDKQEKVYRLLYKLNILRHLNYLLVK